MVRCNAQVRRAFLDHLQDGVEHTDDGAEWPIFVLGEATQAIEVAENLVRTVDEMNDHGELFFNRGRGQRRRTAGQPSRLGKLW